MEARGLKRRLPQSCFAASSIVCQTGGFGVRRLAYYWRARGERARTPADSILSRSAYLRSSGLRLHRATVGPSNTTSHGCRCTSNMW